jgi:hypothetical protein
MKGISPVVLKQLALPFAHHLKSKLLDDFAALHDPSIRVFYK